MDAETFKKVCLPFSGNFYRVAFRLLNDSQDAEDVVQDVFEKLWKTRETLPSVSNIEAFGVTITRNMCLDRLKSTQHKISKCDPQESLQYEMGDTGEEVMMQGEIQEIKSIVSTLPQNQQKVFDLRFFKDCSLDEIEQITGLGAVNIRVSLMRARQTVKERFFKKESV